MEIPSVEELPFFDEETHHKPSQEEKRQRAAAYGAYLTNLRSGHKPGEE